MHKEDIFMKKTALVIMAAGIGSRFGKGIKQLAPVEYYTGVIIAVSTFLIIGIFHPIVMKTEYYTGTRYWWVFLVAGIICIGAAFLVANVLFSAILGVVGASCLWSIGELFEQRQRCEKGWFPKNPKRIGTGYYRDEAKSKHESV